MPAEETPAARYRRLAQECLDVAATFPDRDQRDALLQMAQVWRDWRINTRTRPHD